MPPLFTSFDDAWRWFAAGGEISTTGRWRERFTGGRAQLLSFQAPVGELEVADEILDLQDELEDAAGDGLVFFDRDMLHVSVRGVGFQVINKKRADDVLPDEVARVAGRAGKAITKAKPVEATVGPINVFPDALVLEVHDGGALGAVRDALAPVVNDDAFGLSDAQYLPHITVAMFRSEDVAATLRGVLPAIRDRAPAPTTLRRIELARWWFTGLEDDDLPERDVVRSYSLRG